MSKRIKRMKSINVQHEIKNHRITQVENLNVFKKRYSRKGHVVDRFAEKAKRDEYGVFINHVKKRLTKDQN